MRFWNYILVLCVVCFAISCRDASTFFGYDTVAKAGKNTLTATEISAAVPKGLTGADSVSYVDSYIDKCRRPAAGQRQHRGRSSAFRPFQG